MKYFREVLSNGSISNDSDFGDSSFVYIVTGGEKGMIFFPGRVRFRVIINIL